MSTCACPMHSAGATLLFCGIFVQHLPCVVCGMFIILKEITKRRLLPRSPVSLRLVPSRYFLQAAAVSKVVGL